MGRDTAQILREQQWEYWAMGASLTQPRRVMMKAFGS